MENMHYAQTDISDGTLFDDKKFVLKFSILLMLIISLSSFVIYQTLHNSNSSLVEIIENGEISQNLWSLEREFSGEEIDLEIFEDDFSDLAELDLGNLELMINSNRVATLEPKPLVVVPPKIVASAVEKKLVKIEPEEESKVLISSQKLGNLSFIKKKFYATNNVSFSNLISKKLYNSKKYKKALKWALISNEIDNENIDSWIMFAKAKVKLGKKEDAISALNSFLKKHESRKVEKLLLKISSSKV
jgi:tetratricopeptide (TPR) repeat protein